ncbi:penicillin-binding protein [Mycobacterium dioxanotrophicus]|uniref:Penicillin-binding protein n=1 Tax=Mycobacterium dioxanotrophicus TaxID=482462 RepID=A0A1Y0BXK9_9MYCO|nr:transglycosylase/D,D-transpeptidase PonA2 [Mycobacterium dioxanotrophicus]ART67624.1 penicillin-binding protein [Mycobacterium dioxanotrophicus]
MSDPGPRKWALVARLAWLCMLAGVLMAALLFPAFGSAGMLAGRLSDAVAQDSSEVLDGEAPIVTTMVDAAGTPIAWLYDQRRWVVRSDQIANTMKLAIVSVEDKRFTEHDGVDIQGTLNGLFGYLRGVEEVRGGSTIEQQYVKNYNLLVTAKTDAQRRTAVEVTPARKLREMRIALAMDKVLSKEQILTRYLNLVSFGNGSFGVQDAARTYFGVDAAQLNWPQAALLAGLVRSTSTLNPYSNPDGALARRNTVLDTLIDYLPDRAEELRAAKATPLGVLPQAEPLPQGCIAAGDRAFFCEYVLQYLARAGLTVEDIARNGYLIRTTLDPKVQDSVKAAIDKRASPDTDGVASVMSVIIPGKDAHRIVAMADSRTYGLDLNANQTVRPQPFSLVGDGAGSIFKIFTTAAALEMGMGISTQLDVPQTFLGKGLGDSTAPGCPKETWCVTNVRPYRSPLSVTDALAQSPNTAFAKLISQIGVPRAVDMAVRLGMRTYAEPGSAGAYSSDPNDSIADYVKRQNIGSFTLGPIELNALELANVGATLASGGTWCPPSPIDRIFDRNGREVTVKTAPCEQVVPEGLANTMANALSKDAVNGTAAGAASSVNWTLPMSAKTGTTEAHRSSAFLGFTNRYAGANYIFDDSATPSGLCSYPLRKCSDGNLYGGTEPALTWYAAMSPIANDFGPVALPPVDPRYVDGGPGGQVPSVTGMKLDEARKRLQDAGFRVADQPVQVNSEATRGSVVGTTPSGKTIPGSIITINTSTGYVPPPPVYVPPPQAPPPPPGDVPPPNVIQIPGLPPITLPAPAPPPGPEPPPPPAP